MFCKSRFSTTSADFLEADYLVRRSRQRQARIAVSVVLLASAAAVIACSANSLVIYKGTNDFEKYGLPPVWPSNFDDRDTQAMLGAGAVVALGSIAVLGSVLMPSVHQSSSMTTAKKLVFANFWLLGIATIT